MKHVRRAAVATGSAVAALALANTGTAFAWNPSDASVEIGCRADAGHVELVLGNHYKAAGDYTLSLVGGTEEYHGRIEARSTVKLTVGYSGKGDTWRYTLADTHVDKTVADVPLCPSATPTPTTTPSVPATPTPTTSVPASPVVTPSATTPAPTAPGTTPRATPSASTTPAAPAATPGAGASTAPALAQTGGGSSTPLALAGGAVLAAGAGLVLAARKTAAKRRA
ncbi:LPXTG cell wall anchor domain-containing protein [Kitasatospora sp. NPDC048296]|uniref:LPXTG cell wall anchor domain-containing protein n=1 Tax=Kitasatospora sp. NPDC048296 TaxID=3364048 RepID=UPI00371E7BC2